MRTFIAFCFVFCIILTGCSEPSKPQLEKINVSLLNPYGVGELKTYLEDKPQQVSFLDRGAEFVHPSWVEDKDKYLVSTTRQMIGILKSYKLKSIDVILFGTHGKGGCVYFENSLIHISDLFTDSELRVIKNRLTHDGWFAFTGCNVSHNVRAVYNFARRINHPVIGANVSTTNDVDHSLWSNGTWMICYPD